MADIYVSTTGNDTTGDGSSGNPYLTIGKAITVMSGGDTVYVKADGTYSISATLTPVAGSIGTPSRFIGYTSTITDGGKATVQLSASAYIWTLSANYVTVRNFVCDCNSQSSSRGARVTANGITIQNLVIKGFTDYGVTHESGRDSLILEVLCVGGSGTAAFYGSDQHSAPTYVDCAAVGNSCRGFYSVNAHVYVRCVSANNTGGSTDGFYCTSNFAPQLINCVAYGNGRDGIRFNDGSSGITTLIRNCVIYGNGGYGVNSTSSNWSDSAEDYNAFGSNTSGARNQIPAGAHDVSLSGNPFVSPGSAVTTIADVWTNFALNATAGAGAACAGAGAP